MTRSMQWNLRITPEEDREIDLWIDSLNAGHVVGLVNRSQLIRGLVIWALRTKPDINQLFAGNPQPPAPFTIHDPESVTAKMLDLLKSQGPMPLADITKALQQPDHRSVCALLGGLMARGEVERLARGIYQAKTPDFAQPCPPRPPRRTPGPKRGQQPRRPPAPGTLAGDVLALLKNKGPLLMADIARGINQQGNQKSVASLLVALLKKGYVERPSRGLYQLATQKENP